MNEPTATWFTAVPLFNTYIQKFDAVLVTSAASFYLNGHKVQHVFVEGESVLSHGPTMQPPLLLWSFEKSQHDDAATYRDDDYVLHTRTLVSLSG